VVRECRPDVLARNLYTSTHSLLTKIVLGVNVVTRGSCRDPRHCQVTIAGHQAACDTRGATSGTRSRCSRGTLAPRSAQAVGLSRSVAQDGFYGERTAIFLVQGKLKVLISVLESILSASTQRSSRLASHLPNLVLTTYVQRRA
jgi:hypothetical protein